MAKTTVTTLTDDTDGTPNAKERRFSIGGIEYSIDLTDENWSLFLDAVEPWRAAAAPAAKLRRKTHAPLTKDERIKIRLWAQANGIPLKERGRFPDKIVQRYFRDVEIASGVTPEEVGLYV
jgi:hypothetical protein